MSSFSDLLLRWHRQHGRHDLPWQGTRDPYRVWLSEIMLQQTQVASVIPYYLRFLEHYPDFQSLAEAPVENVMALWSGLGYYARARNLHRCALTILHEYDGQFPHDPQTIATLPGIGRSTAHAIAAFCFDVSGPILDGNVKRVLTRCYSIEGFPGEKPVENRLWALAQDLLPTHPADTGAYIQAQMDLGATLCTPKNPDCPRCPLNEICIARKEGRANELPTPKPRKALPQRETTVLLLHDGSRCLLERRPPSGIWGGLLSLPEVPDGTTPLDVAFRLGVELQATAQTEIFVRLEELRHTFTHFQLTLHPLLARVQSHRPGIAENDRHCWLSMAELEKAALPTPIRKILTRAGVIAEVSVPRSKDEITK